MSEALIAAIAAGIGGVIAAIGTLIVNIIKAKKEKTGDLEAQYSHTENLVKLYQTQTNSLIDIQAKLTDVAENLKEGISELSNKVDSFHQEQQTYNIVMIRHDITQVYETYREAKKFPDEVAASCFNLYDIYKKIGGNSYITEIVEEMKGWERT